MIELAVREREIVVDVKDPKHPGLGLRMLTLSDAEAAKMMAGRVKAKIGTLDSDGDEGIELKDREVAIEMPYDEMMEIFARKVQNFEGDEVKIGGVPFDPRNEDHLRSLQLSWKMNAMSALIRYASTLPEAMVKNSLEQARDSLPDTTS